jgi:hypothetical protein
VQTIPTKLLTYSTMKAEDKKQLTFG